jgi:selenocysteine-specific elongation factor
MTEKHFVVATAGHVDHGKSALVKALTGMDPDRLPEEKARKITIDLGFAHLEFPESSESLDAGTESVSASVVDVPGHEDFVRNMIAGLGSIDMALLVVAADDGWMPQTEEHLQILTYLGLSDMVVAVNKSDIASPTRVVAQIEEQLRATPFARAPIIPTSTRSGDGLEQLKKAIRSTLRSATPQRNIGKPRLLIDRAFNLSGIGAVVTGTLSGGSISAGESVFLQPGNFKTRVRSLQTHRANVAAAQPGMRAGINLAELPKHSSTHDFRRGRVLTTAQFDSSAVLDVMVERSGRLQDSSPAGRPLKSGTNVYLHYGTGRVPAVLVLAGDGVLAPGKSAIGQLRLDSPVLAFAGDRFVVRDRSEQHTIAGGVILDTNGNTKSFRTADQQKLLGSRGTDPHNPTVFIESELGRRGPIRLSNLLPNSNFSNIEIRTALTVLENRGRVILCSEIAADARSWQSLRQRAIELVEHEHEVTPEHKGLDLAELRAGLPEWSPEIVDALIEDLCAHGFVRSGSIISRASHRPTLPTELEPLANGIVARLAENPLDPPGRTQLAADTKTGQALRYLIGCGDVIEIAPDLVLSAEAFARAKEIVARFIQTNGPATVSELRGALNTSRRVAVPLLERLDRDRITLRQGDRRLLSSKPQPVATSSRRT